MISRDAEIGIHISDNKLKALANYSPPSGNGKNLSESDIISKLKEKGVKAGIKNDSIKYVFESLKPLRNIVIAEGVAPEIGEKARIEKYFELNARRKAVEKDDGSVDFHDLGEISSAKEGQSLYRKIPPTIGKPGYDVFGNEIPGLPGKDIKLVLGPGTIFDKHDPNLVRAYYEGEILLVNGIIQVSKIHIVDGDIDFSTGNINFNGAIKIKGDLKGGFKVEALGDIEIVGNVEDSVVIGGNDVIIRGGFVGNGEGCVSAKRDVYVKFVENQKIETDRDIIIENQSYHAKLFAGNSILARTGKASIVGGLCEAKKSIEAGKIGSEATPLTIIKVGIDPKLAEKIKQTGDEIRLTKDTIEKMEKSIFFLYRMKIDNNGKLPPQKQELMKKIEEARDGLSGKLKNLEQIFEKLMNEQKDVEKAFITADICVYPKVTVYIGNQWISLEENFGPSIFHLFKSEIIRNSK